MDPHMFDDMWKGLWIAFILGSIIVFAIGVLVGSVL